MQELIRQLEQQLALAKLAEALRLPETCIVRRPVDDTLTSKREVVLIVSNDTAAEVIVNAIKGATKHQ